MSDSNKHVSSETITFHYLKAPDFRTLFAHGASVGGTTRGEVVLTPYIERVPIPTQTVHELSDVTEEGGVKRGKVGDQVSQVSRDGIIREMDVSVILPLAVAEEIGRLLLAKAEEVRQAGADDESGQSGGE